MSIGIYGYPTNPSSGGGGGNTYNAGAGLSSTDNGNSTYTLAASGPFLLWYNDPTIANSRGLVAGNNVSLSTAINGQLVISAAATGGGAPTVSSYITGVTEASLPNSSVATQGNGITIAVTPGGAATFGVASTITGANILTWAAGDTIFTNRRQMIFGSGLNAAYGTNTLTLTATSATNGTVTSVDLAVPSFLTVSGNPLTTAGTITIGLASQAASTLLIAPTGGSGTPTSRRLVGQDLPIFGSSSIAVTTNATGGLVLTSLVSGGGSTYTAGAGIGISGSTISVNGVTSTTTTPYNPVSTDFIILVNSSGGNKVVPLPAPASSLGRILHIKKFDTSGNTVTVNPNASETIDGASSYILSAFYQEVSLACDGTNWAVF